jgi:hypothetical protein
MDYMHPKPLPERPMPEVVRKPKMTSLAKKIQAETDGGDTLIAFALGVFEGTITDSKWSQSDAMQWLADRGFGKATQHVDVEVGVGADSLIMAALAMRKGDGGE